MNDTSTEDLINQSKEIKQAILQYLRDNNLDIAWLANQGGTSESTMQNYLSRRIIPASKRILFTEILNSSVVPEAKPEPEERPNKKRRRTKEQIRLDEEREKEEAQRLIAEGAMEPGELEEEPAKDYWAEHIERETERVLRERTEVVNMVDLNSVTAHAEGVMYRLVIPQNIYNVLRKEAKFATKYNKYGKRITVTDLISEAVADYAAAIEEYESKHMAETIAACDRELSKRGISRNNH